MVDDLITAAVAAVSMTLIDDAMDDAPRAHDPMADFSYTDDEAGDSDNTSKKKKNTTPPRRSANMAVTVDMPDKCRGKYPQIHRRSPGGVLRRGCDDAR